MKKTLLIGVVLAMVASLTACGISQEEHDAVIAERDAAQAEVESLQKELAEMQNDLATTGSKLAETETDLTETESDLATTESDLAETEGDLAEAQSQISDLNSELAGAEAEVAELEELATALEGSQVGNLSPSFQLNGLDGKTISLRNLRGNPVMLNFWATWCGPCRIEMPYLQQIYEKWRDKGLILFTVNLSETTSKVQQFIQDNNYSLPVLLDSNGDVGRKYNITAVPTTFFIDKYGIIRERKLGSFTGVEAIESSLSKIMTIDMTTPPTTTALTSVPILLSPANGAILDNGRTDRRDDIVWDFDWSDVANATQYQIYVIGASATIPVIYTISPTSSYPHRSTGSYIISQNLYGWKWKVRAMVNGQWGEWSEERTFDVELVNTDSAKF